MLVGNHYLYTILAIINKLYIYLFFVVAYLLFRGAQILVGNHI